MIEYSLFFFIEFFRKVLVLEYCQYISKSKSIEVLVNQYIFLDVLNIGTDYFKKVLVHTLVIGDVGSTTPLLIGLHGPLGRTLPISVTPAAPSGLHELCTTAIGKIDTEELRTAMYENVVLSGGSSMLPGIGTPPHACVCLAGFGYRDRGASCHGIDGMPARMCETPDPGGSSPLMLLRGLQVTACRTRSRRSRPMARR